MLWLASGDVDFAVPCEQHLDDELRRCAEAEEPDALAVLHIGDAHTAKANDAGAEQRGSVVVAQLLRQDGEEVGSGGGVLGVTALVGVSGVGGLVTEVFAAAETAGACAVGGADPRDADSRAFLQTGCMRVD